MDTAIKLEPSLCDFEVVRSEGVSERKSVNGLAVPTSDSASLKRNGYFHRRAHRRTRGNDPCAKPPPERLSPTPGKRGAKYFSRAACDGSTQTIYRFASLISTVVDDNIVACLRGSVTRSNGSALTR
jgi:hypothetical protein